VRFGALLEKAEMLGFDGLVTGHYARVGRESDGRVRLYRARNDAKDQSYVLHALGQRALERAHFPLGDIPSKDSVRGHARELGLPNWNREDSLDVCFVGEGRRPGDVVAERRPESVSTGVIVNGDGEVVGSHEGLAYYTVGQRRGIGSSAGGRRYVTAVLSESNALVVGPRESLGATGLAATRPRFVSGEAPHDGARVDAVLRYGGEPAAARFVASSDGFELAFDELVRAVAPGQAVVLYDGDEVLGGGTIVSSR
jgi:tRNA-specific 2-thiouridylase